MCSSAGKQRIMRLERISLVIVAVCAVIVIAVPFFRGFTLTQIRQINPLRDKSIWTGDFDPVVLSPYLKTDAQLLKEHPKDFLLRLALVQELFNKIDFSDTKGSNMAAMELRAKQSINKLLRDYPRECAVYSVAMRLPEYDDGSLPLRIEGNGIIVPEDIARNWKDREPPAKEQLDYARHCLELMDRATVADPDNGWFHYMKAYYLHTLHRDAEARREIHLSATAPHFTDYNGLKTKSIDHVFDLRGGLNPDGRVGAKAMIAFPAFARMREEARILTHLAYKEIQNGNTDQGVQAALDITNSGYKMAKNAPMSIHALVGIALHNIGAATFDPTFEPDKKKSDEDQQSARLARYKQFLIGHGYPQEAAALETQWQQAAHCRKNIIDFASKGWGEESSVLTYFSQIFATAIGILTISLLFIAAWAIASLLTIRGGAKGLWDKRAAITSALLSALVLVLVITDLVFPSGPPDFSAILRGGSAESTLLSPVFLLLPLGITIIAMLAGLVVMIKRTPKDGENRRMPVSALLTAYLAAVGGLAYLTYGIEDFSESSGFFESLLNISPVLLIIGPIIAMVLYALLRAVQSRFDRVRKSAPLTFIATIRYSSAIAIGIFSIAYLCMMMLTAHHSVRADAYARNYGRQEAAILRSAFK